MDTKEIVDRVLKGEDYSALLKDVQEDKQDEVRIAVRDALDSQVKTKVGEVKKATEDLISVRKGTKEIEDKKNEVIPNVLETFKKEQVEKAKRKFFADPDYNVTPEMKTLIEAEMTTRGVQSTDSDFVFDEIKKIYGALNVDNLIQDKKKAAKGAAGAVKYTQGAAGGSNSGPGGDPDKYSQGVRDLHEAVIKSGHPNYTLDQAKDAFEKGVNFKQRKLA